MTFGNDNNTTSCPLQKTTLYKSHASLSDYRKIKSSYPGVLVSKPYAILSIFYVYRSVFCFVKLFIGHFNFFLYHLAILRMVIDTHSFSHHYSDTTYIAHLFLTIFVPVRYFKTDNSKKQYFFSHFSFIFHSYFSHFCFVVNHKLEIECYFSIYCGREYCVFLVSKLQEHKRFQQP